MGINNIIKYINNPDSLNEDSLVEIKNLTIEYPYFQTAWMLYLKNLKQLNHSDYNDELQRVSIKIADRKKLYYFLNPEKTQLLSKIKLSHQVLATGTNEYFSDDAEIKPREGKGKNDLIENFIASETRIKISNQEINPSSENDLLESSVSENDEIITETFANILVEQKKYKKAIASFEKLSLKYPEKSVYFAGRIEELKKLIDSKSE